MIYIYPVAESIFLMLLASPVEGWKDLGMVLYRAGS